MTEETKQPEVLCKDRFVTQVNAQLKGFEASQRSVELDVRRTEDALRQKKEHLAALTGAIEAARAILKSAQECDSGVAEKCCTSTD